MANFMFDDSEKPTVMDDSGKADSIPIRAMERIRLAPGDILVVHVGADFRPAHIHLLREGVQECFKDNPVVVMAGVDRLSVIEKSS